MAGISVVLGTYNGGRYLREQLDSLAAQTRLPEELLVSDDGSSDDTLDQINTFAASAPFPVTILEKAERLGCNDNFLYAAAQALHELIAFCDQDDLWLPRKLEIAEARLLAEGALLSMHRLTIADEELRPRGDFDQEISGDRTFGPLELDPHVTGWGNTMLFRRELVHLIPRERRPRHPGETRLLAHDTWVYVLAAALGRIAHIAEPLILYRLHSANNTGLDQPGLRERLKVLTDVPVDSYRERALFDAAMADLFGEIAREGLQFTAPSAQAAICFEQRAERWRQRARLFTGRSPAERVRAYRAVRHLAKADPAVGTFNRRQTAKDLALGVTGLGRRR